MDEREHAALRALNTDREWLMRSGRCAVILVAGEDAAAADAAYLELQRLAPDFWSVRNRVHRTVGPDPQQRAVDNLVDLLKPRFGGDRGAAARWLDTRRFQEDWLTYRLWRDGPSREAWLAMAAPTSIGRLETRLELERGILLDSHRSIEPSWSTEPIGEAIDHQRWPTPVWPSGRLDPEQHALVSALGAMLDRQGNATLYRLPEEQTSRRLDDAVNTLGLLRESRYAKVLHLDSSEGLEFAIVRCLHEAGESDLMPGLVQAARRLAGALGETRILLLVTSVTYTDLLFLRAALPRTEFVASVLGAPRSMFCVLGSRYHGAHLRWATGQLSRWPAGTKQLTIDSETAVLDLRTALAGAKHVVLLADSRLSDLSTEEWNPVALASSRVVGFSIGAPPFPTTSVVTWRGDLGRNEATALDRLLAVAHELAGDPLGTEGPARAPWPTTDIVADDPSALQQESFSGRNVNTADTSHSATSIAVEDQPLVRAFKPWAARAPRTGQPARLLEAAYEAVPFDGRTDVLEILRRFTDGPERNGVQVIVGPSGAGKTRLLLEWCKRLRNRDQPWLAGFLKNELPEDLAVLTLGRAPRLVVLDYADCEPANAATVVRTMLRRREGPPMRVVLLARDDGSWLRDLRRQDDVEVEACLGAHEVVRLGPLYKAAEDRARGLSIAKARFLDIEGAKAASGTSAASQQTVFEEGQGERVLYLHMQALLQALGDGDTPQIQPTASEVLERVLDHECGFWWKSIQARGQSVSDRLREGALLAAAALVLCG
ncbi:MAG: hypothetical protein JKY37_08535, partial [Nannocystaceae bacterium]|nr:hypothetical protein [Nannocystaceae bacterium]